MMGILLTAFARGSMTAKHDTLQKTIGQMKQVKPNCIFIDACHQMRVDVSFALRPKLGMVLVAMTHLPYLVYVLP